MEWTDQYGLKAAAKSQIRINSVPDQPPSIASEDFPRQAVVLNSEQLNFHILANDDFGVRRVGLEWNSRSKDQTVGSSATTTDLGSTRNERVLALGTPESTAFEAQGTFKASDLGIESELIEVRLWAEDYLPGRERAYSVPYHLYVLTADDHALWGHRSAQ